MSLETVSDGQEQPLEDSPSVSDDTDATPQAEEPQAQAQPSEGAESQEPQDADLTSQAFYESLSPEKQKELNRYFTQRTQGLSAREKELESSANLIRALQNDPKGAVTAMAKQLGLKVEQSAETQAVQDTAGQLRQVFEQVLGSEAAEQLMPAFERIAEDVTKRHLAPIQEWQTQTFAQAAEARARAALESFAAKHPDWKQHEGAMQQVANKLRPADGVTETEWLELLYTQATANVRDGEATKRTIDRMTRSAAAATPPASGVPSTRVAPTQPKNYGTHEFSQAVRDAFNAAKEGVRWEQ